MSDLTIDELLAPKYAENSADALREVANDLEVAVEVEKSKSNPSVIYLAALEASLANAKVDSFTSQSYEDLSKENLRLSTIKNAHSYFRALLTQLNSGDECLIRRPNVVIQIGAQVMGLSSSLFGGILGAAVYSVGSLVDYLVTYLRSDEIQDSLDKVLNARLGEAVACALEGTAATYCEARDAQLVLRSAESLPRNTIEGDPRWKGLELIGRETPSYFDWAIRLSAGSSPTSHAQALDKKRANTLQDSLRSLDIDLSSNLGRFVKKFPDPEKASLDDLAQFADSIAEPMAQNIELFFDSSHRDSAPGPLATLFTKDPKCGPQTFVYTGGVYNECILTAEITTCIACIEKHFGKILSFQNIEAAITKALDAANEFVGSELSLFRETNSCLVLGLIDVATKNRMTSRQFLKNTQAYYQNLANLPEYAGSMMSYPLRQELSRLEQTFALLEEIPVGEINEEHCRSVVDRLRELLVPLDDVFSFTNALRALVKYDIDLLIEQGKIDDNLSIVLQLSNGENFRDLIQYLVGLEIARSQTRGAKKLTLANLVALEEIFSEVIAREIQNYDKDLRDTNQDPREAFENLSLYCSRLLLVPGETLKNEYPDIYKICAKTYYRTIYADSDAEITFQKWVGKPFYDRVCTLYDFFRETKLHGFLRHRGDHGATKIVAPPQFMPEKPKKHSGKGPPEEE